MLLFFSFFFFLLATVWGEEYNSSEDLFKIDRVFQDSLSSLGHKTSPLSSPVQQRNNDFTSLARREAEEALQAATRIRFQAARSAAKHNREFEDDNTCFAYAGISIRNQDDAPSLRGAGVLLLPVGDGESRIVTLGGESSGQEKDVLGLTPNYFNVYNTKENVWSVGKGASSEGFPTNSSVVLPAFASSQTKRQIFAWGGRQVRDGSCSNDLVVLEVDPVTKKETTAEFKRNPMSSDVRAPGRFGATLTLLSTGTLVMAGGSGCSKNPDDEVDQQIWLLEPNEEDSMKKRWRWVQANVREKPQRRVLASTVTWLRSPTKESILLFGGCNHYDKFGDIPSGCLNSIRMLTFDIVSGSNSVQVESTLLKLPGGPPSRGGHSSTMLNESKMMVFGGCGVAKCYNDVWILNLDTDNPEKSLWKEIHFTKDRPAPPLLLGAGVIKAYQENFNMDDPPIIYTIGGCAAGGPPCSVKYFEQNAVCEKDCQNGASYVNGTCICTAGRNGRFCEGITDSPCGSKGCSQHGECKEQACQCNAGFAGIHCEVECPNRCSNHGKCDQSGSCECEMGFIGKDCGTVQCPDDCSGHGNCAKGKCDCQTGFYGPSCAQVETFDCGNCLNNSKCVPNSLGASKYHCECPIGYTGQHCGVDVRCPDVDGESENDAKIACNGKGICKAGKCKCVDTHGGAHCEMLKCPGGGEIGCSGHGKCNEGVCECHEGFQGKDCSEEYSCKTNCNGNGRCVGMNKCKCNEGFEGNDCSMQTCPAFNGISCAGHGTCDKGTGNCLCKDGYAGIDCSEECPNDCGGPEQGKCVTNLAGVTGCMCAPGFSGPGCATSTPCPANCNGKGECFRGKCICDIGYSDSDCSVATACPNNCGDYGECGDDGRCSCPPGWSGDSCQERDECDNDCSGHGLCQGGFCFCDPDFTGDDCSKVKVDSCKGGCNERGVCMHGKCVCESAFKGKNCELLGDAIAPLIPACAAECYGHGICDLGQCICHPGWRGIKCDHAEVLKCPNDCSGHGVCEFGICFCVPGFTSDDCSDVQHCDEPISKKMIEPVQSSTVANVSIPVGECSGHGSCKLGKCFCNPQYSGDFCEKKSSCKNDCSSRGVCIHGKCSCISGFAGKDCSALTMGTRICDENDKNSCSGNGVCQFGRCFCNPGFEGFSCKKSKPLKCPKDCHLNGVCSQLGTCHCNPGYSGKDCGIIEKCPNGCSKHGVCRYGKCYCAPGYARGPHGDCSQPLVNIKRHSPLQEVGSVLLCPNACSERGICHEGKCYCEPGYEGTSCEIIGVGSEQCPHDCKGSGKMVDQGGGPRGICALGRCFCFPGFKGVDCGEVVKVPCPGENECSGHGECRNGECQCNYGFEGDACEKRNSSKCALECNHKGVCIDSICHCQEGFYGASCTQVGLQSCVPSCKNGNCIFGTCVCKLGYKNPPSCDKVDESVVVVESKNSRDKRLSRFMQRKFDVKQDRDGGVISPPVVGMRFQELDETELRDHTITDSLCPKKCSLHGKCAAGRCWCNPGWTGEFCNIASDCDGGCGEHGQCELGRCVCKLGFTGVKCQDLLACSRDELQECSGNGICWLGKCLCDPGFTGLRCSKENRNCPDNCNSRGLCMEGRCYCVDGFTGENCIPVAMELVELSGKSMESHLHSVLGDRKDENKAGVSTLQRKNGPDFVVLLVGFSIGAICLMYWLIRRRTVCGKLKMKSSILEDETVAVSFLLNDD